MHRVVKRHCVSYSHIVAWGATIQVGHAFLRNVHDFLQRQRTLNVILTVCGLNISTYFRPQAINANKAFNILYLKNYSLLILFSQNCSSRVLILHFFVLVGFINTNYGSIFNIPYYEQRNSSSQQLKINKTENHVAKSKP